MPLHAFAASGSLHTAIEGAVCHGISIDDVFFVVEVGVKPEPHGLFQTFESGPVWKLQEFFDAYVGGIQEGICD